METIPVETNNKLLILSAMKALNNKGLEFHPSDLHHLLFVTNGFDRFDESFAIKSSGYLFKNWEKGEPRSTDLARDFSSFRGDYIGMFEKDSELLDKAGFLLDMYSSVTGDYVSRFEKVLEGVSPWSSVNQRKSYYESIWRNYYTAKFAEE